MRQGAKALLALRRNKIRNYAPYTKQKLFHDLGSTHRERCFFAANQSGKSICGAAEVYWHLSGRYPDWWQGRRFPGPTAWWIANETFEQVRDNGQRLLMGEGGQEAFGTGIIPKRDILDWTMSRSTSDCVDTVWVAHKDGGRSYFKTKAYNQGRLNWQGWTGHGIWCDEEPGEDIYSEAITRLEVRRGLLLLTATPLKGPTQVVGYFWPNPTTTERALVMMTRDECGHFTADENRRYEESLPPHEVEARTKGLPIMGEGLIFPVAESVFLVEPFEIPSYYRRIGGLDFGYDHPTAATEAAINPDTDCFYVVREYCRKGEHPREHAMTLQTWGSWLPFAWPHDGHRVEDKDSDTTTAQTYRTCGVSLLPQHATFPDGSMGLRAGLNLMLEAMRTDRFKVFSTCVGYRQEMRAYHQKDGNPVKINEDRISSSRYAYMMRRFARCPRQGAASYPAQVGVQYDPRRPQRGVPEFEPAWREQRYNPYGGS